ncbi:MAG: hypothetical protein ACI9KE_006179, partial [Polyangiales bacterium]
ERLRWAFLKVTWRSLLSAASPICSDAKPTLATLTPGNHVANRGSSF